MKPRSCLALCGIWNRATNPAALRTDHQARRAAQLAHIADLHMQRWQLREGRDWQTGMASGKRIAMRFVNPFTGELVVMRRVRS